MNGVKVLVIAALIAAPLRAMAERDITKECCGCCGGLVGPGSVVFRSKGEVDLEGEPTQSEEKARSERHEQEEAQKRPSTNLEAH